MPIEFEENGPEREGERQRPAIRPLRRENQPESLTPLPAEPQPVEVERPPRKREAERPARVPGRKRKSDVVLPFLLLFLTLFAGLLWLGHDVKQLDPPRLSTGSEEAVNDEVLVYLKPNVSQAQVDSLNQSLGIQLAYVNRFAQRWGLMSAVVPRPARPGVLAALRKSALIANADLNSPMSLYATTWKPNDPLYSKQWHLQMLRLEEAWPITKGKGAIVAVVDSGVGLPIKSSYTKPHDFQGTSFAPGYDFVEDDDSPEDENEHGTHVAGTIAETTDNNLLGAGVAPEATILPVRVMNAQGSGGLKWIVSGIQFAADHGANVINLSLGSRTSNTIEQQALQYALNKNVTLVCAAGNDNDDPISYPARYPECIAVSSVGPTKKKAPYSDHGDNVDIAAPGGDTSLGQDAAVWQNSFVTNRAHTAFKEVFLPLEGTSMAAPHVAGVAALIVSLGVKDPKAVRSILRKAAVNMGSPQEYGAGLLDAKAAVDASGANPQKRYLGYALLCGAGLIVFFFAGREHAIASLISLGAGFFFPLLFERMAGYGSWWNLVGHSVLLPIIWLLTPDLNRNTLRNAMALTFGLGIHFIADLASGSSPFQVHPPSRIALWFDVNLLIAAYLIVSAILRTGAMARPPSAGKPGRTPAYV